MDRLGAVIETSAFVVGDAEHLGNHQARHLACDVGDKVALATAGDLVDDQGGKLPDPRLQGGRRARGELSTDEATHPRVEWGIGDEQHGVISKRTRFVRTVSDHDCRLR